MRLLVARALDPLLRRDLADVPGFEELPLVRGRTVVPKALGNDDVLIAGHPNHLGVFDQPEVPWIAVTGRWSSLRPIEGAVAEIALEAPAERATAEETLRAVRTLASKVTQIAGVTVALRPESPVLVVLLTVDPAAVAESMALPGCQALTAYPELPGGLRIEPGPVGPGEDLGEYAAALGEASKQWM